MRNFIIFILGVIMLSGCGSVERMNAKMIGYSKMCIDGVSYIQFTSGATVQVDQLGKPISC